MLTTSFSAFTNRICSWNFENNFEFPWKLTCQVLVLEDKGLGEPLKNLPPVTVSTLQQTTYIVLYQLTPFPLSAGVLVSSPWVRSLPEDSKSQLQAVLR